MTINLGELEVRIHSALIEHYGSSIRLWYLARALDGQGCGAAEISIEDVASVFSCTTKTVKNWLKSRSFGKLFHSANSTEQAGRVKLYYRSQVEVAAAGPGRFGSCGWTLIKEIVKGGLKRESALITAESVQRSSCKLAKLQQANFGNRNYTLLNGSEVLENIHALGPSVVRSAEPSELCTGVNISEVRCINRKGHSVLLVPNKVVAHGGSYVGIGNRLSRHKNTVARRLKNVQKVQVAYANRENSALRDLASEEWNHVELGKFFMFGGKLYKAGTNLYGYEHQLSSLHRRRQQLAQRLNQTRNRA